MTEAPPARTSEPGSNHAIADKGRPEHPHVRRQRNDRDPDHGRNTLGNLGPLRALAGLWQGMGVDEHRSAAGTERSNFVERYEIEPIDPQTTGPQLLYGMRYHTHVVMPGEVETVHDQVGYWLWEPAARSVTLTLGTPRGQSSWRPDSPTKNTRVRAHGSRPFGRVRNAVHPAPRPVVPRRELSDPGHINADDTWSYEEEKRLQIPRAGSFVRHINRNTLTRISPSSGAPSST